MVLPSLLSEVETLGRGGVVEVDGDRREHVAQQRLVVLEVPQQAGTS